MALVMMIFKRLNVPIAAHKTMGPLTCIEYLGIILDTDKLEARLPQEKVNRICNFINKVLQVFLYKKGIVAVVRTFKLRIANYRTWYIVCFLSN